MFPFFRRKKTKLEIFKENVSGAVHGALSYVPVDRLEDARDAVGDVLHSAAETAGGLTRQIAVKTAAGAAMGVKGAHDVVERAGEARESLSDAVGHKTAQAGAALSGAREGAYHVHEKVVQSAAHAGEAVSERAHATAQSAAEKAAALKAAALKKAHRDKKSADEELEDARAEILALKKKAKGGKREAEIEVRREEPEVEVEEGHSKLLWIGLGLLAGAVVAIFFAPSSGRRSRAAIKDRVDKVGRDAATIGQIASERASDLGHRATDAAASTVENAKGAVETAKDAVANVVETVKDAAPTAKEVADQAVADDVQTGVIGEIDAVTGFASNPAQDARDAATAEADDVQTSPAEVKDDSQNAAASTSGNANSEKGGRSKNGGAKNSRSAKSEAKPDVDAAAAAASDFHEGDDTIIADRVRTELGQNEATRDIPTLNVESCAGVVTLRGPKLEEFESQAVEKVVSAVEGVREVHTEHLAADDAGEEATFVG